MPFRHLPARLSGNEDAVIKVNNDAHDEAGITTEAADQVVQMTKTSS